MQANERMTSFNTLSHRVTCPLMTRLYSKMLSYPQVLSVTSTRNHSSPVFIYAGIRRHLRCLQSQYFLDVEENDTQLVQERHNNLFNKRRIFCILRHKLQVNRNNSEHSCCDNVVQRICPFQLDCISEKIRNFLRIPVVYAQEKDSKLVDSKENNTPSESKDTEKSISLHGKLSAEMERRKVCDEEVEWYLMHETGLDRLIMMYSYNYRMRAISPDLKRAFTMMLRAFVSTALITIIFRFPIVKDEHRRSTQISKHMANNLHRSKRAQIDYIYRHSLKKGGFYGGIMCTFLGCWVLSAKSIAVYRNKSGIFDFTLGGVVVGSLFRFMYGPHGMVLGGLILGTAGTILGGLLYSVQKLSGATQDKLHFMDIRELMEEGGITRPAVVEIEYNRSRLAKQGKMPVN